jgi:hypothetical protein
MNSIAFIPRPSADPTNPYREVEVLIDGVSLIDRLREVERPFAEQEGSPALAGDYLGLSARTTFLPSRHFLGDTRPLLRHDDHVVLLACTCGCEGCWDFVGRIAVSEGEVVWDDFCQVHREWDYAALGRLVFDRRQYETALQAPGAEL